MLCFVCFSTINTPTVFILPCAAGQGSSSAPSASSNPCLDEGAEVPPRPGLTPSRLHSRCRAACTMPMMTMVTMVPQGGRAVLWASKGAWGQERATCPAKIRTKMMTQRLTFCGYTQGLMPMEWQMLEKQESPVSPVVGTGSSFTD